MAVLHGGCWDRELLDQQRDNILSIKEIRNVKVFKSCQGLELCPHSLLVAFCCRLEGENPQRPSGVRMLQEWELLGSSRYVFVLLSPAETRCLCSSPTLLAKGRGFEFKPQLSIPGSSSPSNQNSELKQKLSRVHPALYKARISCPASPKAASADAPVPGSGGASRLLGRARARAPWCELARLVPGCHLLQREDTRRLLNSLPRWGRALRRLSPRGRGDAGGKAGGKQRSRVLGYHCTGRRFQAGPLGALGQGEQPAGGGGEAPWLAWDQSTTVTRSWEGTEPHISASNATPQV